MPTTNCMSKTIVALDCVSKIIGAHVQVGEVVALDKVIASARFGAKNKVSEILIIERKMFRTINRSSE